ncbi:iron dicitrate transporter FecR [Azorhizobium oxalatiphilum]|uniref:Iron dicitrate transporter FecR n=1 Tax=Azorhizobium oxalatiphilum TaxID=980631 RepID=A0A917BYJ6_9HYPH|nr:FecR domain-containing protein [Azorhizobium oxalatiphilum]GGF63787.1 iron dicitrate transporter FecR [Azorhizobium oxalatiphilum]
MFELGGYAKSEHERLEEATGWILRLQNAPANSLLRAQFDDWIAASPANRAAWQDANVTWRLLGAFQQADERPLASEQVVAEAFAPATAPSGSGGQPRRQQQGRAGRATRGRRATIVAAALAAGLAIWIVAPALLLSLRADHLTHAGQNQQINLADGSTVDLGGSSAISTQLTDGQRQVTLLSGQAFFDVRTDKARPFIVDVAGIEVKVTGTAFDVQATSTTTTVALLHGSIEAVVERGTEPAIHLRPGQMLTLDRTAGTISVSEVPAEDIGSWRQGRIFIADASVGEAVELLQRYHQAWITIPDRALAQRRVSGLFDLKDVDAALSGLVEPFGGKVRQLTPLTRVISRW